MRLRSRLNTPLLYSPLPRLTLTGIAQLNPSTSAPTSTKVLSAQGVTAVASFVHWLSCAYNIMWPAWPALRAALLPRLRLAYNGLTALLGSGALGPDEGRYVLAAAVFCTTMAYDVSASVHKCGGDSSGDADLLVVELAQVLVVQPQFLELARAGAAWARQHALLDLSHISRAPVSMCLEDIVQYAMRSLHNCFCQDSPCPISPAVPRLQQAMLTWCTAAVEMVKAGGWRGQWRSGTLESLLAYGLSIPPFVLSNRIAEAGRGIQLGVEAPVDRPRFLECGLEAAEWLLSARGALHQSAMPNVLEGAWDCCSRLVARLVQGKRLR